jgi:hypothetical protein
VGAGARLHVCWTDTHAARPQACRERALAILAVRGRSSVAATLWPLVPLASERHDHSEQVRHPVVLAFHFAEPMTLPQLEAVMHQSGHRLDVVEYGVPPAISARACVLTVGRGSGPAGDDHWRRIDNEFRDRAPHPRTARVSVVSDSDTDGEDGTRRSVALDGLGSSTAVAPTKTYVGCRCNVPMRT